MCKLDQTPTFNSPKQCVIRSDADIHFSKTMCKLDQTPTSSHILFILKFYFFSNGIDYMSYNFAARTIGFLYCVQNLLRIKYRVMHFAILQCWGGNVHRLFKIWIKKYHEKNKLKIAICISQYL